MNTTAPNIAVALAARGHAAPAGAWPRRLPLARYRFTARLRAGMRLPGYAGSLLRGQFGAALRQLACMTRQPHCMGCPLLATCPYTRIFEAPPPPSHALQRFANIPNAYVVEPPRFDEALAARDLKPGDMLEFHMVLAGDALAQLALVVFAWQRALARGLTRERAPADLLSVHWLDTSGSAHPVWHTDAPTLRDHDAVLDCAQAPVDAEPVLAGLRLHVNTPMRLQHQGHPLRPRQLTPRALIAALARRAALVMEFHAGQSDWGPAVPALLARTATVTDEHDLHWHDWTRYSSRQQQEMTLGGVLGRWTLLGSPEQMAVLWPWLCLGQWLHVGKNATMGMGGYTLEPLGRRA